MAHSRIGSLDEALELQRQNNVCDKLAGVWYHVSKFPEMDQFRDDHPEDWTFLTRSPSGGTDWGDRLLEVVVIEQLPYFRMVATDNRGDTEGFHEGLRLPDWWLYFEPQYAGYLMVTKCLHVVADENTLAEIRASEPYLSCRRQAIEKLET